MIEANRNDGREWNHLRDISFETGYQPGPQGSVLVSWGENRVLCSAAVDYRVPIFLRGKGKGWVTAEYDMLPGSSDNRIRRDRTGNGIKGRSQEIQRLIGRSLRQCVNTSHMPDKTITVDCDVLVADGGTRVASITGSVVALRLAILRLLSRGKLEIDPWKQYIGALSLGVVQGIPLLDLCYVEDSRADMDMNIVAGEDGMLVEIQASAEENPVASETVFKLAANAIEAIREIVIPAQKAAAGEL
ncbi:MAG: ribonuclease PH [Candidatus Fermentibacteraceae bacterium]|nr:ribonuclease PH [Candidatus Fermentibacteraceae bacterium]